MVAPLIVGAVGASFIFMKRYKEEAILKNKEEPTGAWGSSNLEKLAEGPARASGPPEIDSNPDEKCKGLWKWLEKFNLANEYFDSAAKAAEDLRAHEVTDLLDLDKEDLEVFKGNLNLKGVDKKRFAKAME